MSKQLPSIDKLLQNKRGVAGKKRSDLSRAVWENRKGDIEEMLSQGVSITAIAKHFNISRVHMYRVLAQLDLKTAAQAVLKNNNEKGGRDA